MSAAYAIGERVTYDPARTGRAVDLAETDRSRAFRPAEGVWIVAGIPLESGERVLYLRRPDWSDRCTAPAEDVERLGVSR